MMTTTGNTADCFRMIAKTTTGLEELLSEELTELGAQKVRPMSRSVEFSGDKRLLYQANFCCRTATRILKPIANFRVSNEDDLYRKVMKVDWGEYLGIKQTFAIDAVLVDSKFSNSLFIAQKVKDGIADRFRDMTGRRPSVDLKSPDIRINVYIHKNECSLAIDSSGEPLFRRGYRKGGGRAPLNEVLGAGIVMQSDWNRRCNFVDAMCGSGTIVIEAALIARNIAPGLIRKKFGFMNWPDYDKTLLNSVRNEAGAAVLPELDFQILGSDIKKSQVREASENAKRAGVAGDIDFRQCDISDLDPPPAPGVAIINPPYGERIPTDDINASYRSFGDAFKNSFPGYDVFVFTGNLEAAKHIGLRTSRRVKMYNGPIECRLLKFEMYKGSRKKK